jgi:heat shock protein HslJ
MAEFRIRVKLREMKGLPARPAGGVRVFKVQPQPMPMRLVLSRMTGGPSRLVLLDASSGKATRFFTLEPTGGRVASLIGTTWHLERIQYSDGKKIEPPSGLRYSVQFLAEGRIARQADNNRFTGSYTVAGSSLMVSPLGMTRMANAPGSIAGEFLRALGNASSFKIDGDRLLVMIKMDSGTITFVREPGAPR